MYLFYGLIETYCCVCDPSPSVPSDTSFGSYKHLTERDLDISRCRHVTFLYSAAYSLKESYIFFVFLNIG